MLLNNRPSPSGGGTLITCYICAAMGRKKLLKRSDFNSYPHCFNDVPAMRGKWHTVFDNQNPIVLEVGCGKADLSYGQALRYPEKNFIGVDIKSVRMWTSAKRAVDEGVKNIAFLRCDIHGIKDFFGRGEVSEVWVTFPDPFPRKKHIKNRLVQEKFLRQYLTLMWPGGRLHFKTDNDPLFEWALEHFEELNHAEELKLEVQGVTRDLHGSELKDADNGIITDYERRFMEMGEKINYVFLDLKPGRLWEEDKVFRMSENGEEGERKEAIKLEKDENLDKTISRSNPESS